MTGLFSKIKYEVDRKQFIREKNNNVSVMISERIQDYINKNKKKMDDIFTHLENGEELQRQGQFSPAVLEYSKLIELNPDIALTHYKRGMANYQLKKFNKAIQDFRNAIALDPTCIPAYSYHGLSLSNLGDIHEAIDEHNKAIKLDPTSAILYLNRAITYQSCQLPLIPMTAVLLDCSIALLINPQYPVIQLGIKDLLSSLFEDKNPQEVFNEIKKLKNKNYQIILLNDILTATPLRTWFKSHPQFGFINKLLLLRDIKNRYQKLTREHGDIKTIIGESSHEFIKQYAESLGVFPIRTNEKKALDYAIRSFNFYEKREFYHAVKDCTRSIKLNPGNPNNYFFRGLIYFRLNLIKEATPDFIDVTKLDPKNAKAYYYLGKSYSKSYSYEDAMKAYAKAITLNPNFTDAYVGRADLCVSIIKDIPLDKSKNLRASAIIDCMKAFHIAR